MIGDGRGTLPAHIPSGSLVHCLELDRWHRNTEETYVTRYVDATEQLVVEIFVRDAWQSKKFYQQLGFDVLADRGSFVVLGWEGHELFLDERPDLIRPEHPVANVRVMVRDVDCYWERAQKMRAQVIEPIADRYYGLRDFTIADPDGYGVRFGTQLPF
jgi:catechol 2,3-dioxygenase-like lactoylglutathione lyase family enzyme